MQQNVSSASRFLRDAVRYSRSALHIVSDLGDDRGFADTAVTGRPAYRTLAIDRPAAGSLAANAPMPTPHTLERQP